MLPHGEGQLKLHDHLKELIMKLEQLHEMVQDETIGEVLLWKHEMVFLLVGGELTIRFVAQRLNDEKTND